MSGDCEAEFGEAWPALPRVHASRAGFRHFVAITDDWRLSLWHGHTAEVLNRSMRTELKSLAMVAVASLLLSGCGSPAAEPSTSVTPTSSNSTTPTESSTPAVDVEITLVFDDCEGCVVGIERYTYRVVDGEREYTDEFRAEPVVVRDGSVTFTLPTAKTRGLTFVIMENPDGTDAGYAAPVVVFQYPGIAAGTSVGADVSAAQRKVGPCWAGTTSAAVTLNISRRTYPVPPGDPVGSTGISTYWASPMASALLDENNVWDSTDGGMGTQDTITCEVAE